MSIPTFQQNWIVIFLLFTNLEKGKIFFYAQIYFLLTNVIIAVHMAKCGCQQTTTKCGCEQNNQQEKCH
jgi:hypothetical protein